jgi:hypothetical protein
MTPSEPDQNDPMKGRVGVPIPAAVQPVSRGLAGGCLDRRDSGQLGKRGFRAQTLRVVPGREQQRTRGVRAGAEALLRCLRPGRGGPIRSGRCQITSASSANASASRAAGGPSVPRS